MKTTLITSVFIAMMIGTTATAQRSGETYGNTLNLGIGIGHYGYVENFLPVFSINYEFDVAKNFTIAPFISYYSYQNNYYWKDPKHHEKYYYRVTVIPVGAKGTYYFDQILQAGSKWDFYLAASLGFAYRSTTWDNNYYYYNDDHIDHGTSGLYLDIHIGTEFHMNSKVGLFLDLSTGISTFGLAVHL